MTYSPTLGRFLEMEPSGANPYVDGMNLYESRGDNPINRIDPSGTESEAGGPMPSTPEQLRQRYQRTGVTVTQLFIKGDKLWGNVPFHTFVSIGGNGYGFYAGSHIGQGGGSSADIIATFGAVNGYVVDDDFKTIPEGRKCDNGDIYKITSIVYIEPNLNVSTFEKGVKEFLESQSTAHGRAGTPMTYNVFVSNCAIFALDSILAGINNAKTEFEKAHPLTSSLTVPTADPDFIELPDPPTPVTGPRTNLVLESP